MQIHPETRLSDSEMIKLCAQASNIKYEIQDDIVWYRSRYSVRSLRSYNPLSDDEAAMDLIRRFELCIKKGNDILWTATHGEQYVGCDESINKAIIECVAKMQLAALNTGESVSA